jgi:hypothetical protein
MFDKIGVDAILTRGISYFLDLYLADNPVLKTFYTQLYRNYTPDITGYTLAFMQAPDLSGFESYKQKNFNELTKSITFLATDFTPPQTQIVNSQVAARSGALTYASDITSTETISITYLEKSPLTVYTLHLLWMEYIREILRGTIQPADKYLDENSQYFGAIDYLASFFIVKYLPDMREISYVGKCVGVYPMTLPSKQLIGSRTTNEVCVLPFEYSCIAYREYIPSNAILDTGIPAQFENKWIMDELNTVFIQNFPSILNQLQSLVGGVSDMVKQVGNIASGIKDTAGQVKKFVGGIF